MALYYKFTALEFSQETVTFPALLWMISQSSHFKTWCFIYGIIQTEYEWSPLTSLLTSCSASIIWSRPRLRVGKCSFDNDENVRDSETGKVRESEVLCFVPAKWIYRIKNWTYVLATWLVNLQTTGWKVMDVSDTSPKKG
jgi:hypothetical protein